MVASTFVTENVAPLTEVVTGTQGDFFVMFSNRRTDTNFEKLASITSSATKKVGGDYYFPIAMRDQVLSSIRELGYNPVGSTHLR